MATQTPLTVVVGMSGGVDSSVSAFLLKEQGYRVLGLFMKNWEEQDENGTCHSADDYNDAMRVCEQIGIPCYSVNFVKEYQEQVFAHFLAEFRAGHTPNPDILCNREIKFKVLLQKAIELGADFLATGHYCQLEQRNGEVLLLRGKDPAKDQSYFLYAVTEKALRQVLFPVGGMLKQELRTLAKQMGLATADKRDSTGICFIGKRDFKEFLSHYIPPTPGDFEDLCGNVVGRHDGSAYYTIGQRKGLAIGGAGEAWFVVAKESHRNVVVLAQGAEHPALYCDSLTATELSWISPRGAPATPFSCTAKVRYRQPDQPCVVERIEQGRAHISFLIPQRAVTPRQSIVFYSDTACLGGGMIESPGPSHYCIDK
jgi:tRNA-specific 2-thiouridylase